MDNYNGQSAAKHPVKDEGSTTIPTGSTDTQSVGKRPVYLRKKNVIYKITNLTTGKIYIGSASWYDKRIGTHIHRLRRNDHDNIYLQNAWNKYGEEDFSFEIIEEANKENLIEREQYWIDTTNCIDRKVGYNIQKIAGTSKGRKMPESARKKIGDFWRGKKFSNERIIKVRKDRTEAQGKKVVVYDKSMTFLHEFSSISECSRQLKVSIASISKQCSQLSGNKKNRKDSHYIFRYKDIVWSHAKV